MFEAGFAAARPIATQFGKWLVPHVLTYEMTKLQWAASPLARAGALCDITGVMDTKLEAVRRYGTMLRPLPAHPLARVSTALAAIRGAEIGVEFAEAFGVLRTAF